MRRRERKIIVMKSLLAAALLVAAFVIISPEVETQLDTNIGDAAITRTCLDRNEYNFVMRWSCRSSLRNVGVIELAIGCGFHKNNVPSDFCANLDRLSNANDTGK